MEICCDFAPKQIILKYCFSARFVDIYAYSKLNFIYDQKKKNEKKCAKPHEDLLALTNTQSLRSASSDTI